MNYRRSEATEQEAVISWCFHHERLYPDLELIHHIPNGGSRNRAEAARLKAQGVKSGVPDLHLPAARGQYHGLYIEMKYGDNGLSTNQEKWLEALKAAGHYTAVCYGYYPAVSVMEEYLRLSPDESMSAPAGSIFK